MRFDHTYALAQTTPTITTVKELADAANASGMLPSELIARVWPRPAP